MREVPLTQGKSALVDDQDYPAVSKHKWWLGPRGRYACRQVGRRTIYMHCDILDKPDGMEIDHINNDTLDNRRENLRICDHKTNRANSKLSSNNTSGYKGVVYSKRYGNWSAKLKINGKAVHLGTFDSPESAAKAYDNYALKVWGEYANPNGVIHEVPLTGSSSPGADGRIRCDSCGRLA